MKKQYKTIDQESFRYQSSRRPSNIIDMLHESLEASLLPNKKPRKKITAQPSAETASTKKGEEMLITANNRSSHNPFNRQIQALFDRPINTARSGGKRARQLIQIQQSNFRLLKKLKDQPQSEYSAARMRRQWNRNKDLISNICEYPFQLERRPKSMMSGRRTHSRKKQGFSVNKIYKLEQEREIDSILFTITIILNHSSLTIVGTSDEVGTKKIIKVQRGQALELLKNQCENRLEGLLVKLRFDGQTLYLINNNPNETDQINLQEKMEQMDIQRNLAAMRKRLERARTQCNSRNSRRPPTRKNVQNSFDYEPILQ